MSSTEIPPSKSKNSDRLQKARQLLSEYQINPKQNPETPVRDTSDSKTIAIKKEEEQPDKDLVAVPDSFWSNAHLQGSGDYVARWAGGVKVAEVSKIIFQMGKKLLLAIEC